MVGETGPDGAPLVTGFPTSPQNPPLKSSWTAGASVLILLIYTSVDVRMNAISRGIARKEHIYINIYIGLKKQSVNLENLKFRKRTFHNMLGTSDGGA